MALQILHLTPLMAQGGAEKNLIELMRYLQPHTQQQLMMIYPLSQYPFFFQAEVEALHIPVTFLDKRPGKLARIPALWRYWRVLHRFKPHVIHAHQWHAMDIARAYYRMFGGAPVIANPHTLILDEQRAAAEKLFLYNSARIVMVSQVSAEQYRELVPGSKVITIDYGIDTDYFYPDHCSPDEVFPFLPPDSRIALYAGRIHPEKNLDTLLQAVNLLGQQNRWHLICVGRNDDDAYARHLQAFIHQNGMQNRIHFLDAAHDIRACYHACDFLILPSHYESMGIVVLEAAACGRPVLVSEAVNRNPLVKHGETGWVFPTEDAHALAQQLAAIFALPRTTLLQMGAAAREHITAHYTIARMGAAYLRIYQELYHA